MCIYTRIPKFLFKIFYIDAFLFYCIFLQLSEQFIRVVVVNKINTYDKNKRSLNTRKNYALRGEKKPCKMYRTKKYAPI